MALLSGTAAITAIARRCGIRGILLDGYGDDRAFGVYSHDVGALGLDALVAGAVCGYPEPGPVDGLYVPAGVGCWQCWSAYRARLATLGIDWAYAELARGLVLAFDHEPVAPCE